MAFATDKNGRAHDGRGRFVSAKKARSIADAKAGKLTLTKSKGKTFVRDTAGVLVGKEIAALQAGGPTRVLKTAGGGTKKLSHGPIKVLKAVDPAGILSERYVTRGELYGQSAPKLVDENASTGRGTFIKKDGELYLIPANQAGALSDGLRELLSDYVSIFYGVNDSPQMILDFIETDSGDVLDFDNISTLSPEVEDELSEDPATMRKIKKFNASVDELTERFSIKKTQKANPTNESPKSKNVPMQRSAKRGRNSGKGKKR